MNLLILILKKDVNERIKKQKEDFVLEKGLQEIKF